MCNNMVHHKDRTLVCALNNFINSVFFFPQPSTATLSFTIDLCPLPFATLLCAVLHTPLGVRARDVAYVCRRFK